jgi:hypothetical protein
MAKRDADWILIEEISDGATDRAAAGVAGVSDRLVRNRRQEPWFVAAIEKRKLEKRDAAAKRLLAAAPDAVRTLTDVMRAPEAPGARVKAATYVLDRVAPAAGLSTAASSPSAAEEARAKIERRLDEMHHTMNAYDALGLREEPEKSGQNRTPSTS